MERKARLLELRQAATSDIEFAWVAWAEAVRPHVTPVILNKFGRSWVDSDERQRFSSWWQPGSASIITLDGAPVGWLASEQTGELVTLMNFVVTSQHRHLGIASIVLGAKMHEWASTAKKVAHSVLKESGHNLFFERLGFKVFGESKDELALLMEAQLG